MNFFRRHWFVLLVIGVSAVIRFTILALSQTHVHSDEAIIGLMAKHIAEGRYFPFYMYGQPYNGSAALEAYVAASLFKCLSVNVVVLKSAIVLLSLGCLFLFHKMVETIFDRSTAAFSLLVFALSPSLLKWHFQVRGYAFYFLSIPLLMILFWHAAGRSDRRSALLFGIVSGLSVWVLELSLTLNLALWVLLFAWRKLSIPRATVAAAGFAAGYSPAVIYNFTHGFANWITVFSGKTGGSLSVTVSALTRPANLRHIFFSEMPKFFGPDTVLWYFPERPWTGIIGYAIAIAVVVSALVFLLRQPRRIAEAFSGRTFDSDSSKVLMLLFLTAACFIPYLLAPVPTASYFFGGLFFLSILTGRLLGRCFTASNFAARAAGAVILLAIFVSGVGAMVDVAGRNEIETLTLCDGGEAYCMTRIPGDDMAAVERYVRDNDIAGAWTTISLTYPLLFETREQLATSDAIFSGRPSPFPPGVARMPLPNDQAAVVIMETNSPLRSDMERSLTNPAGVAPKVTEFGTLTVLEQR